MVSRTHFLILFVTMKLLFQRLLCTVGLLLVQPANASSVLSINVDYMLQHCELIFEGQVLSSESHWNDNKSSIYTLIKFQINEVIKGDYSTDTLTLHFGGGNVDGMALTIDSLIYPKVGEQGIYFIEGVQEQYINPLIGWSQGHFRLLDDAQGNTHVMTESGKPIMSIQPDAEMTRMSNSKEKNQSNNRSLAFQPFSHGTATGIITGKKTQDMAEVMTKVQFKQQLRSRMQELGQMPSAAKQALQ